MAGFPSVGTALVSGTQTALGDTKAALVQHGLPLCHCSFILLLNFPTPLFCGVDHWFAPSGPAQFQGLPVISS